MRLQATLDSVSLGLLSFQRYRIQSRFEIPGQSDADFLFNRMAESVIRPFLRMPEEVQKAGHQLAANHCLTKLFSRISALSSRRRSAERRNREVIYADRHPTKREGERSRRICKDVEVVGGRVAEGGHRMKEALRVSIIF